jgi:tetratricopeptide (TPR) repeat protein
LLLEALDAQRRILGPDHPSVASTLVNLAAVAREQGDLSEAHSLLLEALDAQRRILGPDHPSVASTLVNLAAVAREQGDLSEAYSLLLETIEISKLSRSESRGDGPDWETVSAKARQLLQELDSVVGNAGNKP